MCKQAVRGALDAIDDRRQYEQELQKRTAAAEDAAAKIKAGKTGDPVKDARRQLVSQQWLEAELKRLSAKSTELEKDMQCATDRAAARLHKVLNDLRSKNAVATPFLDRLEVWRQMDASQRVALQVMRNTPEETLEDTLVDKSPGQSEAPVPGTQPEPSLEDDGVEAELLSHTQRMLRLSSKFHGDSADDPDGLYGPVSEPNMVDGYAPEPDQPLGDGPQAGDGLKVSTTGESDGNKAQRGDGAKVSTEGESDGNKAQAAGDGLKVSTEGKSDGDKAQAGDGLKIFQRGQVRWRQSTGWRWAQDFHRGQVRWRQSTWRWGEAFHRGHVRWRQSTGWRWGEDFHRGQVRWRQSTGWRWAQGFHRGHVRW